MRKGPSKRRSFRENVDPTRMALAALERIRTVLRKAGRIERLGDPLGDGELAGRSELLGGSLPPSYAAVMRAASQIGEPEAILSFHDIASEARSIRARAGDEGHRYVPFCRAHDTLVCFDKGGRETLLDIVTELGELPIVVWDSATSTPTAAANHFGEWLDAVADAREEALESAAKLPPKLARLLEELGFRFESAVVARVETADVTAVSELIGDTLAKTVRGNVGRLFDASGRALLSLDVDDFVLAVSLRTGRYVFEAEDVFRWLRYFRDVDFFDEEEDDPTDVTSAKHEDRARDLRRASAETPLVQGGVATLPLLPATRHVLYAASGSSAKDFHLVARSPFATSDASSVVLHVVDGAVATSQDVPEILTDLFAARDGTLWGLTRDHAVRIAEGNVTRFPLRRPGAVTASWKGIGGGERVLVWGAGTILEFDGNGFVAFEPSAGIDPDEHVAALASHGLRITMLVCSEALGALARFDSVQWQPIAEDEVIDGRLIDVDVWRGSAYVLDRAGNVHESDAGPPRPLTLPTRHPAMAGSGGRPKPIHGVRAVDGGFLFASEGGVILMRNGEPAFYKTASEYDRVALVRLGPLNAIGAPDARAGGGTGGVLVLAGSSAWIYADGAFAPIDLRAW